MVYHYATQEFDKQKMARALGIGLPISMKHSVEVCKFIKNKNVAKAKKILDDAISLERAIPYTRYNQNLAHKTEMGPGRFPVKTCEHIKKLLESAESNAQFLGLNTSNLIITDAVVQKAATAWHFGRKRRRKMKRSNVEIFLTEIKPKEKSEEKKSGSKKADQKTHAKSSHTEKQHHEEKK